MSTATRSIKGIIRVQVMRTMHFIALLICATMMVSCMARSSTILNRADFFYSNEKMKWEDGIQWCLSNGGLYASVHSDLEVSIIQGIHPALSTTESNLYLGGYWDVAGSSWKWVDGTNFDYQFQTTNPSPFTGSHDGTKANSSLVGGNTYVIAQSKSTPRTILSQSRLNEFQVLCQRLPRVTYFAGWEGVYYSRAQGMCNKLGGELASIHSLQDYLKIKYLRHQADAVQDSNVGQLWLGLISKRSFKGKWKWEDDTAVDWWPNDNQLVTVDDGFNAWTDGTINASNGNQIQAVYQNDNIISMTKLGKRATSAGYISPGVACQRVNKHLPSSPELKDVALKFNLDNNSYSISVDSRVYKADSILIKTIKTYPPEDVTYGKEPPVIKKMSQTMDYYDYQHSKLNTVQLCAKQCTRASDTRKMGAFYVKTENYGTTSQIGECTCVTEYQTNGDFSGEISKTTGYGFFALAMEEIVMQSPTHIFHSAEFQKLITPVQIFACNNKGCGPPTELNIHCEMPRLTANGMNVTTVVSHDCLSVSHSGGDDIYPSYSKATVQGTLRVIGVVNERNRFPCIFGHGSSGMLFNVEAGGNLILKNLNIRNGNNVGYHQFGGAIRADSAFIYISNAIFFGNHAYRGSALWATNSSVDLINVNFTNNTITDYSGSGKQSTGGGTLRLEDDSILYYNGGSMCSNGVDDGVNSDIGAGVSCYKSTCILKRVLIHSNTAMRGSGIFQRGGTLTVSNSIIENNGADALTTHGGAISLDGRIGSAFPGFTARIESSILRLNEADEASGLGGGIYTNANGNLLMINVTIVNNTANDGGNIYTNKDGVNIPTLNLINSKFGHSPFALDGSCTGSICGVQTCSTSGSNYCHSSYGLSNTKCSDHFNGGNGFNCLPLPVPSSISVTLINESYTLLQLGKPQNATLAAFYKVLVLEPTQNISNTSIYNAHGKFILFTPGVYTNEHAGNPMRLVYNIFVTACTQSNECGRQLSLSTFCYPPRSCFGCQRTCTIFA